MPGALRPRRQRRRDRAGRHASKGSRFRHPLAAVDAGYDRIAPVYLADYATAEDGTGIVHSSPAYGVEDFNSCRAHGLAVDDILNPVQGNGVYDEALPLFGGMHIWKAKPEIVEALRDAGRLLASSTLVHSYPHCWRHKTPVIYRAAAQWFVRMDAPDESTRGVFAVDPAPQTLRECALDAIDATEFYPGERPRPPARHDREPARLVHQPAAQLGRAAAVLPAQGDRRAASRHAGADRPRGRRRRSGRRRGVVAPERRRRARRRSRSAAHYAKSNDILDVWFDSGSTFFHVLRGSHPGTTEPDDDGTHPEADLYLEGHDQHRGWFHSSLLIACAIEGHAPYRGLLTHGFTVDGSGRKMSKSLGNFVALHEITAKLGAEIIRLWCASTDYSGDLAIDDKILARVVDAYRRIRNTLRFLLANTSDFDAANDAVPLARAARDRPLGAGAHGRRCRREIVGRFDAARGVFSGGHYGVYEFHPVVAKLQVFCSEDLGAFYLDMLKDRLYTTAPLRSRAARRRPRSGTSRRRCCAGWRRS